MPAEFEPAIIWWHKGKLQVALDTIKYLSGMYKSLKVCDYLDDASTLLMKADSELTREAEEKNNQMYEEAMKASSGSEG